MATLADFGIPGVGSGILHPKMTYRFSVLFKAELNEGANADEAQAHLRHLSMQVVTVAIPTRTFDPIQRGGQLSLPQFKNISTKGDLVIEVEDDVGNKVAAAVEYVVQNCTNLTATVLKLDGNEGVLEAFKYGVILRSMEHSVLDYAGSGSSKITGDITHPETDQNSIQLQSRVSLHLPGSGRGTVRRVLNFHPTYSQSAIFTGSDEVNPKDFL
jgi:hypothetical protein